MICALCGNEIQIKDNETFYAGKYPEKVCRICSENFWKIFLDDVKKQIHKDQEILQVVVGI